VFAGADPWAVEPYEGTMSNTNTVKATTDTVEATCDYGTFCLENGLEGGPAAWAAYFADDPEECVAIVNYALYCQQHHLAPGDTDVLAAYLAYKEEAEVKAGVRKERSGSENAQAAAIMVAFALG
jgi:hypothetical protein